MFPRLSKRAVAYAQRTTGPSKSRLPTYSVQNISRPSRPGNFLRASHRADGSPWLAYAQEKDQSIKATS